MSRQSTSEEGCPEARASLGSSTRPRLAYFGDWVDPVALQILDGLADLGAGYDYIDVDACTAAGVIVCNQGGTNREAVAEHTLGQQLCGDRAPGPFGDVLLRPDQFLDLTAPGLGGLLDGRSGVGSVNR